MIVVRGARWSFEGKHQHLRSRRPVLNDEDTSDDPYDCDACHEDVEKAVWEKKRYDNRRVEIFQRRMIKEGLIKGGDKSDEYPWPEVETPFDRDEVASGKEKLYPILSSGMGEKLHSCVLGRMASTLEIKPFLPIGSEKVRAGIHGLAGTIRLTLVGRINQSPGGRWQWLTAPCYELVIPPCLHHLLGDRIVVDGYMRAFGEQVSRRKSRFFSFIEREPGTLWKNIPEDSDIGFLFEEVLIPMSCCGTTEWVIYAELVNWIAID